MRELIQEYLEAKAIEAQAIDRRVAIGEAIAKELGASEEGSKTYHAEGYKITVKVVVNRKVDWFELEKIGLATPPIRIKKELDMQGYRWFAENDKAAFEKIQKTITSTPGRTQVEIKEEIRK